MNYILSRSEDVSETEYDSNLDLRLATERAFIIIGEAMSQLRTNFPTIKNRLDDHLGAVGFRNLLVHRYWDLDNDKVYSIIRTDVAPLKAAAEELLRELLPPT